MRPLNHFLKAAAGRLAALAVMALMLGQLSGCSVFRPAPLALPAGFMANPQALALTNPQTRQAAYRALFPELKALQSSGALVAGSIWRRGKEPLNFDYYSRNDAGSRDHLLRMKGYNSLGTFFDIVVRGRQGLVVIYPAKVSFQGEIPAEGSPFADRFGVEPWDLATMLAIGQAVAGGDLEPSRGRWTSTLTARGGATAAGLHSVVLDNRSGLPRSAEWRLGGKTYDADYEGWDFFKDQQTQALRLMPAAVRIHRWGVSLKLNLTAYMYDRVPTAALFDVSAERLARERGFAIVPLEKLKKVL